MTDVKSDAEFFALLDNLDQAKDSFSFSGNDYHACEDAYLELLNQREKIVEQDLAISSLRMGLVLSTVLTAGLVMALFKVQGFA